MKTIILTGGGTAGHVMPNMYLLEDLKKSFDKIYYIGTKNGIEKNIISKTGLPYYEITATKLIRGKIIKNLLVPFKLIKSICESKKILKKLKPNIIFSKGGFVSLPVCIAGKMLKIPIISHESDFSLGLANKLILKTCTKLCVNFEHLTKQSPKIVYSGAIIPDSFKKNNIVIDKNIKLNPNKKTILVVGGSIGSKIINDAVFGALTELAKKYNILHHVGRNNKTNHKEENYFQFEFYDNMPYLYSAADIVVGRAGAGIVFESAYMKKPMLLIPLENKSSRGDQVQNAEYFEKKGCAKVLREQDLNSITLHRSIEDTMFMLPKMHMSLNQELFSNGKQIVLSIINQNIKK